MHRLVPSAAIGLILLAACSGDDNPTDPVGANCASGTGTVVTLAVGEGKVLSSGERSAFCVDGESAGGEYTLVPVNAATTGTRAVDVLGLNVIGVAGPPTPVVADATIGSIAARTTRFSKLLAPKPDLRFESKLRARERRVINANLAGARKLQSARGAPTMSSGAAGAAAGSGATSATGAPSLALANVGDQLQLNANANSDCTAPDVRTGRVVAVTQYAVIVADVNNPAGGFSDAEYAAFGQEFDQLVYPVITDNFGTPSDVDANGGRSLIFFTRAVNELTPSGVSYYVGGFFFGRDLTPKSGCQGSNLSEMFYMIVPDPTGVVNGNVRSKEFVQTITTGTIAHEFQHLINASKKIANGQVYYDEDVWMNEGLSHVAEELMFYHIAGLAPRSNITSQVITANPARIDAFLGYAIANFSRLEDYLEDVEAQSPFGTTANDDELSTRGAAWQLLRYSADRKGGDERQFWRGLVSANVSGVANLERATGEESEVLVRDWAVAQYADDTRPGVDANWTHPSWSFRSVYQALQSCDSSNNCTPHGPMKLKVRPLADNVAQTASIVGGTAAYYRFGVGASEQADVRISSQSQEPPATVQLVLFRSK